MNKTHPVQFHLTLVKSSMNKADQFLVVIRKPIVRISFVTVQKVALRTKPPLNVAFREPLCSATPVHLRSDESGES